MAPARGAASLNGYLPIRGAQTEIAIPYGWRLVRQDDWDLIYSPGDTVRVAMKTHPVWASVTWGEGATLLGVACKEMHEAVPATGFSGPDKLFTFFHTGDGYINSEKIKARYVTVDIAKRPDDRSAMMSTADPDSPSKKTTTIFVAVANTASDAARASAQALLDSVRLAR